MNDLLTALDVANQEFRRELRGYSRTDVDDFLDRVAETLQHYAEQVKEQERRIKQLEEQTREYGALKESLQEALLMAQKSAREKVVVAEEQAGALLAEARTKADHILAEAREQAQGYTSQCRAGEEEARRDLDRVVRLRCQAVAEIRDLLEKLGAVLDTQETQDIPLPPPPPPPQGKTVGKDEALVALKER